MEALDCIWGYQEIDQELKNMLLQTRIELETARIEAKEDMRRNEENVKQLLYFLKIACQERNEARHERDQLQKLLNKLMPVSPTEAYPVLPSLQVESPICTLLGNSGMTISDSISESYNPQSYGSSSPVDSLLDMVSSPDLPNINMADSSNLVVPSRTFIQEYNCPNTMSIVSHGLPEIDHASAVIDNLVKGKPLPQKGKLLQTVMEAGPLLKTLLVSGSLPQWRNPPPVHPFQVPPFSIKGGDPERINVRPVANLPQPGHNIWNSSISETSYGSSQMYSASTLTGSGTCLNKRKISTSAVSRDLLQNQLISGKQQRCQ